MVENKKVWEECLTDSTPYRVRRRRKGKGSEWTLGHVTGDCEIVEIDIELQNHSAT